MPVSAVVYFSGVFVPSVAGGTLNKALRYSLGPPMLGLAILHRATMVVLKCQPLFLAFLARAPSYCDVCRGPVLGLHLGICLCFVLFVSLFVFLLLFFNLTTVFRDSVGSTTERERETGRKIERHRERERLGER